MDFPVTCPWPPRPNVALPMRCAEATGAAVWGPPQLRPSLLSQELSLWQSTYVFVTSDHGYNMGQHNLPSCKLNVYDHDVRVPMAIRGPGIQPMSNLSEIGSHADIAPTLLSLAGIDPTRMQPAIDGKSLLPWLLTDRHALLPTATRERLLIERARLGAPPPPPQSMDTQSTPIAMWDDELDLKSDLKSDDAGAETMMANASTYRADRRHTVGSTPCLSKQSTHYQLIRQAHDATSTVKIG